MSSPESITELRVPIRTVPALWDLRELTIDVRRSGESRDLRLHAAVLLEEIIAAKIAKLRARRAAEQVA